MSRHTTRAGRRAARFLLGLAALTAMLAIVGAVPVVLLTAWRYLGPPVPSLHELAGPDDGTLFVRVLCLIGWAGWITFTWAVLAEILAQRWGWRLPAWGWQQHIAAAMISAIAMMLTSPAVVSATASPVRAAPAATAPAHSTTIQATEPRAAATGRETHAGYIEHVVQPGEQMPALAERFLGDKYQWHAIAAATYGTTQPDGRELRPGDTRAFAAARSPLARARNTGAVKCTMRTSAGVRRSDGSTCSSGFTGQACQADPPVVAQSRSSLGAGVSSCMNRCSTEFAAVTVCRTWR